MKIKEMLTVREIAELFGMSRQGMRKHVDNLEATYLAKNSHGHTTVLWSGVEQLADKLGQPELLRETTSPHEKTNKSSDLTLTTELLAQLKKKDEQIEQLQVLLTNQQKLLDQQQQLTLQTNEQIAFLTQQERLSEVLKELTDDYSKNDKTSQTASQSLSEQSGFEKPPKQLKQKKWWHFLKD